MADQLNIKAHNVIVKEENFINVLSNIVYATQKPILHGAEFGMYYAYQAMSKLNHKVVYSGHGSDEFWGYQDGIYFPLMSKEFMVDMHSHYYLSKLLYQSYPAGWYKFIQQYLLPIINVKDKYIENMLWDEVFKYYKDINCLNPYKRARYHMMKRFLVYVNLMVDSISMHFSIEDRPIFQDKALVNLSFMISEYQKNNFGISNFKPYLKLALENILPQKILNRPKIGFQPPKSERYKEILLNYLMSNKSALTNNFKTSALKDFDFTKLLFITSLNIWCEQNKVSF
jgi:asparagine synthase (glutamine-hydrolysing)